MLSLIWPHAPIPLLHSSPTPQSHAQSMTTHPSLLRRRFEVVATHYLACCGHTPTVYVRLDSSLALPLPPHLHTSPTVAQKIEAHRTQPDDQRHPPRAPLLVGLGWLRTGRALHVALPLALPCLWPLPPIPPFLRKRLELVATHTQVVGGRTHPPSFASTF
jgi:hypothetical protein